MELVFNKVNDRWESEFKIDSNFNLHIEGVTGGNVQVYQRSTENGEYAFVRQATPSVSYGKVYDVDFTAVLYPKYIKVSCATEPTLAVVTDDRGPVVKIEHHFEFNNLVYCEDDFHIGMEGGWLEETQYGNFYSLIEKLASFLKEHGEFYGDDDGAYESWSTSDESLISKYTNLTFNGYKPVCMGYSRYNDDPPYINIELDGPSNFTNGTYADIYEDYVYFCTIPE